MVDESPEQIRERVHAEELAKGSDPRVAEGRAKSAEARAREGLPIEPDKAWRAKLEKEGLAPQEAASEAPPVSAQAEAAEEQTPAGDPAQESPTEPEAPEAPAPAPPAPALPGEPEPRTPAVAAVASPAEVEPAPPPEIGDPIELETEGLDEIAGIKIRDPRLPAWLLVALFAIAMWAMAYLLFAGGTASSEVTGCRVESGGALVCASPGPEGVLGE